jgi:hypothetical protein
VETVIVPLELGARYVGVDLRCRDVRMAEHLLNRANIGVILDKMGGEWVPQGMRRNAFEPAFMGIFYDLGVYRLARQRFARRGDKKVVDLNFLKLSPLGKIAF